MSDFTFPCEFCQTPLTVPDDQVGADVTCGHCGRTLTVPRQQVTLKLKDAKRKHAVAQPKKEDLSGLTETSAFGGIRAEYLTQRKHVALAKQLLVGLGLVVSLAVIVIGFLRYIDNKKATEDRFAQEEMQRDIERALQRGLWAETPNRNRDARAISPRWALSDDDSYGLLLVLNALTGTNRQEAVVRFTAMVRADATVGGLQSECYVGIAHPGDVAPACDKLVGMAIGLAGDGADATSVAVFREIALKKAEMSVAGTLKRQ